METLCTFCRETVHPQAMACACCGAQKSSIFARGGLSMVLGMFFGWGNYLLFGPTLLWWGLSESPRFWPGIWIASTITVLGGIGLWKLSESCFRLRWMR